MRKRTVTVAAIAFAVVFLLGFGANEIVRARRVIIGDNQVVLGQDAFGGYLIIRDIHGNEVFRVQGGEVRMPTGGTPSSPLSVPRAAQSDGDKIAQLIKVRPFVVDPAIYEDIRELIAVAEDLESNARKMELQAGALRDRERSSKPVYYWDRWGVRHQYAMTDGISNRTLRGKLRDHALELKKLAKVKRGEANRLERPIAVPRQVVTVWNGTRQIILITKGDLGNKLSKIPVSGFFSWTGSAARAGDIDSSQQGMEHYEVRTIKVVSRPNGWLDAP